MPVPSVSLELLKKEIGFPTGKTDAPERFVQAVPRISRYLALLDILGDIQLYCSAIQTIQDRMGPRSIVELPYPGSMRDFTMLRDTIEHRLLAYNPIDNSTEEQVCWAVALIFTHCVIFPLPNRGPLDVLLDRLIALLQILGEHGQGAVDDAFLLWVSIIGAMACQPTNETQKLLFLDNLTSLTREMGFVSWSQLENLLHDFVWLDRACGTGGQAVWTMLSSSVREAEDVPRQAPLRSSARSTAQHARARTLRPNAPCTARAAPWHSTAFLSTDSEGYKV